MTDETNNRNEDDTFNFCCDSPPFHVFWKTFPNIRPFIKKGAFHKNFGEKFHHKFHHGSRIPYTQVKRNDEGYFISMELPGISKDEINLEATNEDLIISARSEELNKEYQHHLYFRRPIRPDEMKAHLKYGILTIIAPYANRIPKTRIDVE